MKAQYFLNAVLLSFAVMMTTVGKSGNPVAKIHEETMNYTVNGIPCIGFVAYDENINGKRPTVLVVHEWWGLTDYPKMRARQLAELGYLAVAVDLFGGGKTAANPKEAQEMTAPFYKDPKLTKTYIDAALQKAKELPQFDPANIAMIGYCFGGYVALNVAKLGENLKGIVSFHGGLGGVPVDKNLLKAKLLICQGETDQFVTMKDAAAFTHKLDSIGADYTFRSYPNATHAFSNPDATRLGKEFNLPLAYNEQADKESWNEMKIFFGKIFKK